MVLLTHFILFGPRLSSKIEKIHEELNEAVIEVGAQCAINIEGGHAITKIMHRFLVPISRTILRSFPQ